MPKINTTKPEGFAAAFEVAGVFIEVGDQILLMHRHPNKPYGETWGLPAGKIEKGETPHQAALREVAEETGIILPTPLKEMGTLYISLNEYDFTFHLFAVTLKTKPEVTHEPDAHIDWLWLLPEEALSYPLIIGGPEIFQFYLGKVKEE